jgi:hypothetical protein
MQDSGPISYELSADEVISALWKRMVLRRRYLFSVGWYAALGIVCLFISPLLYSGGAALLLYALMRPYMLYSVLRRSVLTQPSMHGKRTLQFNAQQISARGEDYESRRSWRHFKGAGEDEKYFYLDVTVSGMASLVPKATMSEEQQALLRGCLKDANLPR